MRKVFVCLSLMLTLGANAQQKVVIGSDLEYGKTFKFSAELVEGDSIYVDWGDGALLRHSTKTSWGATANISGKLLSNTISYEPPSAGITIFSGYSSSALP